MVSFKKAIEKIYSAELLAYEVECDNKYATFKEKIDGEVFNSETADKLFADI
ncbi:MAG: hypothetical protein LBQ34_04220 [Alphaproteobacteria bacterium]|jgi:hypothetical protein|nr:hypothetical protein [Alphaproteobacteria bacterium]